MFKYLIVTEVALDVLLMNNSFSAEGFPVPDADVGLESYQLRDNIDCIFSAHEPAEPYFALINTDALSKVLPEATNQDVFRRIARVVKSFGAPPIHLPRQWSEYHYQNLLTFFAMPKSSSAFRWVVETNGPARCVRFDHVTSRGAQADLANHSAAPWPQDFMQIVEELRALKSSITSKEVTTRAMAEQIDLQAIGSTPVVQNRSFEEWEHYLSNSQSDVLAQPIDVSIRIVGPAGSGKTLALCMRAMQIARDSEVQSQGMKTLIVTHSWAMAERVDGILRTLNGGALIDNITVYPLLDVLREHAGNVGRNSTEIVGHDSTEGRMQAVEIIKGALAVYKQKKEELSEWIVLGLNGADDSRHRIELLFNLYEEISGVIAASSIIPDDDQSLRGYLNGVREDWMPPFATIADRYFVIGIYRSFIRSLIDRSAITTDQFVLDSIRVLETFAWRMKRETDGYDFILIDELQLFDSQERTALHLLGRSRKGIPFITAEDPFQGIFSSLHAKKDLAAGQTMYLDTVHRFNKGIFEFINFIYQKFPLNALPLRIDVERAELADKPTLHTLGSSANGVAFVVAEVERLTKSNSFDGRICVATMGDIENEICIGLDSKRIFNTRLHGFDDVEQLSYSKRSVIVAPWQYIGGTQFSHVIVAALNMAPVNTEFGKRLELTSIYLSCSRATESLTVVCVGHVPQVLIDAKNQGLLAETEHF